MIYLNNLLPSVTNYHPISQVPADIYAVTSSSAEEMGFVDGATGKRRLLPVVEAEEGANATLECRAGGIPLPNITWVSRLIHNLGTYILS